MKEENEESRPNKGEYEEYLSKAVEWVKTRDAMQRKHFDYQERWHGWRSPIGLGIGFLPISAGLYFLSLAWTNLR